MCLCKGLVRPHQFHISRSRIHWEIWFGLAALIDSGMLLSLFLRTCVSGSVSVSVGHCPSVDVAGQLRGRTAWAGCRTGVLAFCLLCPSCLPAYAFASCQVKLAGWLIGWHSVPDSG